MTAIECATARVPIRARSSVIRRSRPRAAARPAPGRRPANAVETHGAKRLSLVAVRTRPMAT